MRLFCSTAGTITTLAILAIGNSGCAVSRVVVCNTTGEVVTFVAPPDQVPHEVVLQPCECAVWDTLVIFRFGLDGPEDYPRTFQVLDAAGDLIVSPAFVPSQFGTVWAIFDGTFGDDGSGLNASTTDPDISQKITVTLVNASSQDAYVLIGYDTSGTDNQAMPFSQTLIPGEGSRQFSTTDSKRASVLILDAAEAQLQADPACAYDDGSTITWDGNTITCDDGGGPPPPPPPPGEVNMTCINNSGEAVTFFRQGTAASEGVVVPAEAEDVLAVPAGDTAVMQVLLSDRTFGGSCDIADPSEGDQVIWDGETVACVEAATASAAASSAIGPLMEMGDAVIQSVSEFVEEVLQEVNPF